MGKWKSDPCTVDYLDFPFTVEIPGHLDPASGKFIWPVLVENSVVEDCRDRTRFTTYVTVKYAVDTDKGARVATYSGRPVTKKYLMFLKYLGLHTHSSNDGSAMGWDGRRQCNGIFDINYHVKTKKVQYFLIFK